MGPVLNHDESPMQVAAKLHPGVYVRSFYFSDPDGITLNSHAGLRQFTESDTRRSRRRQLIAD